MPRPPGRWFYLLAAVPPAIGCTLAYLFSGTGIAEQVQTMPRLEVPGERALELTPGQHIIYEEAGADRAGRAEYTCRLFDPAGHEVLVEPSVTRSRYRVDEHAGVSVLRFYTRVPGRHDLVCEGAPAAVAVGRGLGGSLMLRMIPAAAGLLIGLAILLVVSSRRRAPRQKP